MLPLEGIRVIDLSRVVAGPYCTMMLGDLGAEVIKIEQPGTGDDTRRWGPPFAPGGESAYFLCVNRNKKSVALNLRDERGKDILRELVKRGDVLIENFKTGTMDRWGVGYEQLSEINPGLVYCAITGYGLTGPYRDRPGYDFVIQAQGGIMSITGPVEGPPYKVAVPIVDITAALFAASAILAALRLRDQTGLGQMVDMSLLDAQVAWLLNAASNYLISGEVPRSYGNAIPNVVPYQILPTADGYLALAVGNDRQWTRFCQVAGLAEWADDPRFATNPGRVENRDVLIQRLAAVTRSRTTQEWMQALLEVGVPCGPVNTIDQVLADPQVQARGMVVEVAHPTAGSVNLVGPPVKFSRTPPQVRLPPPLLGQHTEEILAGLLEYEEEEIRQLHEQRVIGLPTADH